MKSRKNSRVIKERRDLDQKQNEKGGGGGGVKEEEVTLGRWEGERKENHHLKTGQRGGGGEGGEGDGGGEEEGEEEAEEEEEGAERGRSLVEVLSSFL